MMKYLPLCWTLLLGTTAVAHAADCGEFHTQSQMNQCASRAYQKADAELNAQYNAYRAQLDETQKRDIKQIQLAWIKYRDLSCAFEASGVQGGSVYPLIMSTCLTDMTQERLQQLKRLANCEEGDLSCPAVK